MNKDSDSIGRKNPEGYTDLTPYDALTKRERHDAYYRKLGREDALRMEDAIRRAKAIFSAAGFRAVGRIRLQNVRTGKIYE
jgi:hypothetical protein